MSKNSTKPLKLRRYRDGTFSDEPDLVCVEEPLEIRLGYGPLDDRNQQRIAVTMRTPGHDKELALGFLRNEGILTSGDDVVRIENCVDADGIISDNIVRVELHPKVEVDSQAWNRNFYTTSSCGVCGKASLESVSIHCQPLSLSKVQHAPTTLLQMPDKLRNHQLVFKHTGGIHACGLFNTNGELLAIREDVGRHNAMDKLSGLMLTRGIEKVEELIITLSGRASFELIQKAAQMGVGTVVAVGAPSPLAVECAERFNITLVGFASRERFNVYAHPARIQK